VIDWLTSIEEEKLFISVITPGEIQRGIESLPDSHCKMELLIWMNNGLLTRFAEQMVTIDRLKPALSTAIQNGMACGRFQSIRRITSQSN